MEIPVPGEKLAIRIWETVEKGFGGLLAPGYKWVMGRVEIALDRDRRLRLAQAEQDVRAIESGAKRLEGGRLVDVAPESKSVPASNLAEQLQHSMLADQIRRAVNTTKAVLHAEAAALENGEQAEGEPSPDREVDADWLYRWRDSASTVSNETLQALWGRALAGEVKSPGTFSLRTLEFLKNLSQKEAQMIARLGPFVIDDGSSEGWVHRGAVPPGIKQGDDLMGLDDLGVISFSFIQDTTAILQIPLKGRALTSHDRLLIVRPRGGGEGRLEMSVYRLTPVGRQVLRLGSFSAREEYLRRVGEAIKEAGFKVELARVQSTEPDSVRYSDIEEL